MNIFPSAIFFWFTEFLYLMTILMIFWNFLPMKIAIPISMNSYLQKICILQAQYQLPLFMPRPGRKEPGKMTKRFLVLLHPPYPRMQVPVPPMRGSTRFCMATAIS
jgi:hypothetical protein